MMVNRVKVALAGLGLVTLACAVKAQAPAMLLQAIDQLEPGQWQVEVPGKPARQMCITDPKALIQLAHSAPSCRRFVIANEAKVSTVHYSCNAAGWGRTTIRVTNPRTAQIDTQGIAANAPFQYTAEARKLGACPATTAASRYR